MEVRPRFGRTDAILIAIAVRGGSRLIRYRSCGGWRVIAAALAVFVTLGTVASPAKGRPTKSATTVIYNQRGTQVGSITGEARHWVYGTTGECWVYRAPNLFRVGITHNPWGAALPDGARRWKVWRGHRLMGRIVWHSRNRWDLLSRKSQLIGYTIGRDGPAAGAARLILGTCI